MNKKLIKPFSHEDHFVFQWHGPDHIKYQKTMLWYLIAGAVLGIFFLYAFLESSWILAVLVVSMIITYWSFDRHHPKEVKIIISEMGIKVGQKQILFEDTKSFRIEHHPPLHTIVIVPKGRIPTEVIIPYPPEINPRDLQKYLKTKTEMHDLKDRKFVDTLARIAKL